MNPQPQESTPGQSLPAPQFEQSTDAAQTEHPAVAVSEAQNSVNIERGVSAQPPVASNDPGQTAQDDPYTPPAGGYDHNLSNNLAQSNPDPGMPAIADDAELIEKEWVLKAKDIVAKTANDPHKQNKEITKIKAEYLKKRFNKSIKISQE